MIALAVLAGLALALLGARHRQWTLFLAAAVLPLALFAFLVAGAGLSLAAGASSVGGALFLALVLARAAHGLFVAPLLWAALAGLLAGLPLPDAGPARAGVALALLLACAALARWRLDLAMRAACAVLGARLVLVALPAAGGEHLRLWWTGAAALLFALGWFPRRAEPDLLGPPRAGPPPLPWPGVAKGALSASVLVAGGIALAGLAAAPLPPPASPAAAARLERLRAQAPRGGVVWPLPSEALVWEDAPADQYPRVDNLDARWLTGLPLRKPYRLPGTGLRGAFSLHGRIAALRVVKDADELEKLRFAARATVAAVKDLVPLLKPGADERALEQALTARFRVHGCDADSFPPLLISGAAAAVPHGDGTHKRLVEGELLVVDVGCSKDGYASDFTRTFPVGGTFSPEQRKAVAGVLAAQQAARAACKAGALVNARGEKPSMTRAAAGALKAAGLPEKYLHGLGHPVGLFVHDVAPAAELPEGAVITIEPGNYVTGRSGIRIEDTFVVGKDGCEPITTGLGASPDEIEAAMRAPRP